MNRNSMSIREIIAACPAGVRSLVQQGYATALRRNELQAFAAGFAVQPSETRTFKVSESYARISHEEACQLARGKRISRDLRRARKARHSFAD